MPEQTSRRDVLQALFHPRAVAVVGASDDTTKHGYIVLNNVRDTGFPGGVYGISRRLQQVNGIPCLPDLASAPEPVDVAFLAIPAEAAVQAVRDAARAGLKAVIVGSAGYAESLDKGGAERQAELARIAREEGIRIVGPNCNGIYNAHHPLSIGFNTSHAKRQTPGGISIFSHSGALFDAMAGRLRMLGAGLSLFASAGNEADLSVLDYMEYAIDHAPTRVIALLIDSLEDGPRFRRLALAAHAAGKPVVALKIGTSDAGARAAVAHSSRMAGDSAAYAALLDSCGVSRVATLEGLMCACALLDRYGRRRGALGAMSTSGAGASLIADRAAALGVPLATFTGDTHRQIDAQKVFSRIGNPLDLGIFGGMRRSTSVPTLLMCDPGVGVALALVHSMNPWQGDPYRAALAAARETSGKPLLVVTPGGLPEQERAWYETHGMKVFTETDIVLEGIGALLTPPPDEAVDAFGDVPPMGASFLQALRDRMLPNTADRLETTPGPPPRSPAPDSAAARPLTEPESLSLLAGFGIAGVPTTVCASLAEARAAADRAGWPVVLKGVAEGVAHKSELGLVRTNLHDAAALEAAFAALHCSQVIVQPMVAAELEAIAGISRSPGVGLVLLAGLGGIHAEALRDVCIWPVPVSRAAIERKLADSRLGRVLHSPRWRHPAAAGALVDLLLRLQTVAFVLDDRLDAVDLNPVMLGACGAVAVDALVVLRG